MTVKTIPAVRDKETGVIYRLTRPEHEESWEDSYGNFYDLLGVDTENYED